MAKKADKDDKESVMDVSKPGKSEPSASSRPIIVSRKPITEDPMMRGGNGSEVVPGPPAVSDKTLKRSKTSIKISPEGNLSNDDQKPKEAKSDLHVSEKDDAKNEESKEEEKGKKSSTPALASIKEVIEPDEEDEKPKEDEPEDKPQDEKPVETPKKTEDSEDKSDEKEDKSSEDNDEVKAQVQPTDGIVDELAKKAVDKKNKDKEDRQASAKQEQIDKLAESKKYALPIGEVTRRRNNRISLIVLVVVIILALVAANFAVDAGLIHTDIKPLTDVIPN